LLLAVLPVLGQDVPRSGRRLIDAAVTLDGRPLGRISDVVLTDSGSVGDLIVRTPDGLVVVSFSSVRYNSDQRAYVVAAGTTPRPLRTARRRAAEPAPDRFARAGRLVREEPPPARLERTPVPEARPRDGVSVGLQDLARYARIYSEPTGSVSMTRNVDR